MYIQELRKNENNQALQQAFNAAKRAPTLSMTDLC